MTSRFHSIVTPVIIAILAISLNSQYAMSSSKTGIYNSEELTSRLKTGNYLQKTDNLMIIIDALSSSHKEYDGESKLNIAKEVMENIGSTVPNIPHRRLLRVFGPTANTFTDDYSATFGMYNTDASDFRPIIATKTGPRSTFDALGLTFLSASRDLDKIGGTHVVVLLSDGLNIQNSSLSEAVYLKHKYGASICYYPVMLGNDPFGQKRLEKIVRIGGCGSLFKAADLQSPEQMTDFVEQLLFAKRRIPLPPRQPIQEETSQNDLISDDQNNEVAEGTNEFINDELPTDTEPVIPELVDDDDYIVPTNDDGEEIIILERQLPADKVVNIELHVQFDLNKATIKDEFDEDIKKVATFLTKYPETETLIEGHTCNLGSDEHNKALSLRRAESVRKVLIDKYSIAKERLKFRGVGEAEPIADNSTEEGRVKNRRVMAVISTIVTDFITIEQKVLKSDFLDPNFELPPIEESVQQMIMNDDVVTEETNGINLTDEVVTEPAEPTDPNDAVLSKEAEAATEFDPTPENQEETVPEVDPIESAEPQPEVTNELVEQPAPTIGEDQAEEEISQDTPETNSEVKKQADKDETIQVELVGIEIYEEDTEPDANQVDTQELGQEETTPEPEVIGEDNEPATVEQEPKQDEENPLNEEATQVTESTEDTELERQEDAQKTEVTEPELNEVTEETESEVSEVADETEPVINNQDEIEEPESKTEEVKNIDKDETEDISEQAIDEATAEVSESETSENLDQDIAEVVEPATPEAEDNIEATPEVIAEPLKTSSKTAKEDEQKEAGAIDEPAPLTEDEVFSEEPPTAQEEVVEEIPEIILEQNDDLTAEEKQKLTDDAISDFIRQGEEAIDSEMLPE